METTSTNLSDLAGKLLIAMPGMGDPRFHNTVIFMCAHSDEGSMGLVVNKPAVEIGFGDLLEQLDIPPGPDAHERRIFVGGPVETSRGFVLHSNDYAVQAGTLRINDRFAMTATKEVLADIAAGRGPEAALAALGYSGWGPGQVEEEIRHNAWLTVEADPEIVFAPDISGKWEAALAKLGITPLALSGAAGRA